MDANIQHFVIEPWCFTTGFTYQRNAANRVGSQRFFAYLRQLCCGLDQLLLNLTSFHDQRVQSIVHLQFRILTQQLHPGVVSRLGFIFLQRFGHAGDRFV